ncbi:MAG: cytochrome c oxidase subunit I, partial [bacterium]|nr:cytochrome c oxidase subunit I [bacterium]
GGLNFIVTIFCMRAPGLSMSRLPLTVWSYLLSTVLGVLAFPALTAGAIMLLFDRHAGTSFFLPAGLVVSGEPLANQGGTPLLWQHLFWFLGHPEVYVLILPAIGIVFAIMPAFTRKPVYAPKLTAWSYVGMSALGMIVWAHHMFISGMSPYSAEYFSVATLLITIPATIIGINMLASLWGGKLRLRTPMLFAIGLIALFGTGGLGGLFLGNATADVQLHDTYFVVGHFHLMIGGVTLLGLYAAVYFWFPKMFGRMLNETLGKIHFWLTFVCYYTIFLLQHFVGLSGMPRRYYTFTDYEFLQEVLPLNVFISWFAFLMGISQLIFVANVVPSLRQGTAAPVNPRQATTPDWTPPS